MCGIAGVYTPKNRVIDQLATIVEKEWNRGHTSFGFETYDVEGYLHARKGKTAPLNRDLRGANGDMGIAHQRYSTRGSNEKGFLERNAQPYAVHYLPINNGKVNGHHIQQVERCDTSPVLDLPVKSMMAIAHNGDIFDTGERRDWFYQCDIKYLAWPFADALFENYEQDGATITAKKLFDTARKVIPTLKGSFSYVGFVVDRNHEKKMFAGRDPWGIKPGFFGKLKNGWAVASEDDPLVALGCRHDEIEEMKRGFFYVFDDSGEYKSAQIKVGKCAGCSFEDIYFASKGSSFLGKSIADNSELMGQLLGKEQPVVADIVVPVPDSGRSVAVGYAYETNIRYRDTGLIKNRKRDKRTFILNKQSSRASEVRRKLTANWWVLHGQRVVITDDSLIRGTNVRALVEMVREDGEAKEVHVRIGSPPTIAPCYLGIDMKSRGEFAAARAAEKLGFNIFGDFADRTKMGLTKEQVTAVTEEIRKEIGADSLGYLSLEGLQSILGPNRCYGCWNPALNPEELADEILTAIKEHPEGYRV